METFVMLTRLSPTALHSPESLKALEHAVAERIGVECPEVEWVSNYAILGPCDYLDIFRAPDVETAMRAAALVRTFGQATTEVWSALEWQTFKGIVGRLSS